MPRKLLKKWLPGDETFRQHKNLKFLGTLLHDPGLWHLNRRSVSGSVAVGLFMAWVPVPFQMLLSALAAIILRVHLPISVVLVWITNPLTMPPMFYFAYRLGADVLGTPDTHFTFELSWEWLTSELANSWQPFLLGCFVIGVISALSGFIVVRILWRLHVIRAWRGRRAASGSRP